MTSPLTSAQAAGVLGVTPRRLRQLHEENVGPPRRADGHYDPAELGKWLRARADPDLRRLRAAKAELAELKLAEESGRLVDQAGIDHELGPMLRNVRDEILTIPATLGPEFGYTTAQTLKLDAALRQALRHVARKIGQP